jgi:hypothetical protein
MEPLQPGDSTEKAEQIHLEQNQVSEPLSAPNQPRRPKKIYALIALVIAVVLTVVLCWLFRSLIPYATFTLPSVIAFGNLLSKDWRNYKPEWARWLLLVVVVVAGGAAIYVQIGQHNEKLEATRQNQANIDGLRGQIKAAQTAQENNTRQFLLQFQDLSEKLRVLETNAATKEDRAEIVKLNAQLKIAETELQNTQKALAPSAKATLAFTFVPFKNSPPPAPMVPNTDVELPLNADGTVHVEFSVLNLTDVPAPNTNIDFVICDQCKFASELRTPTAMRTFDKLPGNPDTYRHTVVDFPPVTFLTTIQADIIPPPAASKFDVGILYRCNTCVVAKEVKLATVHIVRNSLTPAK